METQFAFRKETNEPAVPLRMSAFGWGKQVIPGKGNLTVNLQKWKPQLYREPSTHVHLKADSDTLVTLKASDNAQKTKLGGEQKSQHHKLNASNHNDVALVKPE